MALTNTINFLPKAFQTVTNQRLLGATVDQLVTNAVNIPLKGYIGRRFAPTYKLGDNYIPEPTVGKTNYQLEASVVIADDNKNIRLNTGYVDLLNSINAHGGITTDHQRLFSSASYSYDGHFDYDKFVNYYNYYWMPNGPLDSLGAPTAVTVTASKTPYLANYTVTRNATVGGYVFSGVGAQANLPLTLARGGTYTFKIDQPGTPFWIQTEPGTSGHKSTVSTVTTRQIFGVTNNGTDSGVVQFTVPQATAQDFFDTMKGPTVDAAATFSYTDIQNQLLSKFLSDFAVGIDGVNNLLTNKTFIFINNEIDDSRWTTPATSSAYAALAEKSGIKPGTVVSQTDRTSVWQIRLVPTPDNDSLIQILPITAVEKENQVFITSGKTYASTQFWLDNNLRYQPVPVITAPADYLYYQDASNPAFTGTIKIVDNEISKIDVERDIIGHKGYYSPNGVVFTNGLKIKFDTTVIPSSYAGNSYYVEGVGTSIVLVADTTLTVPEAFGQDIATVADYITVNRGSQDQNAWSRSNRWIHKDVISATAAYNNSVANYGPNMPARRPIIEFEARLQLFNHGNQAVGAVDYIVFDSTNAFVEVEGQRSYSINGRALREGDSIVFANDFDPTIVNQVWQVSIQIITSTRYITLTKAGNSIKTGQNLLVNRGPYAGHTFAYTGTGWFECQRKYRANQPPVFDVVDAEGYSYADSTVYPASTFKGTKIFGYNIPAVTAGSFVKGSTYKILSGFGTVGNLTDFTAIGASVNEYGVTFTATGAGTGTGTAASVTSNDSILGFPLTYQTFNNIGDISFSNFYDVDTFDYTSESGVSVNSGFLVKNSSLTAGTKLNSWATNIEPTEQFQIFTKFFDDRVVTTAQTITNLISPFNAILPGSRAFVQVDVLPVDQATVPHVKVYLNNKLLDPNTEYALVQYGPYYAVVLMTMPAVGDKIDVAIFSSNTSKLGYYEIPDNLDFNALNENFKTITLGQLRTHYNKLIENTSTSATGSTPLQDSYLKQQGGTLLQHRSPLVYAMTFLSDPLVNFVNGIDLARKEYAKFKNKFLSLCSSLNTLDYKDPVTGVDTILKNINLVKNNSFPWYYSDMVPQGDSYSTIQYTVLSARQTRYEISSIFNNTKLSNRAVLVYVNNVQQRLATDYTVSQISPEIIFNNPLDIGDVITIRDYSDTDGNYIPETPTKLGLYPKFTPKILVDTTYQQPTTMIQGHDGSLTPAFGDFRDQYLLELELRIYNNLKNTHANALDLYNTVPGRFRTTDYSLAEFNRILGRSFLTWAGANNIKYTENTSYDANNPWTWNFSGFTDAIDKSLLQGSWRAIYNYWFDTVTPHTTPWKMLGIADRPSWWITRYGPAPYTAGNQVLWEDLEAGYIWNGGNDLAYTDARFARPGLSTFIPVDTAGNLLNPLEIPVFTKSNSATAGNNFAFGQQSPAEFAWRSSSDYAFGLQLALALTRPAEYFSTQLDTALFFTQAETQQFANLTNQHISPKLLSVNGETVKGAIKRTSGYINWIADGIKNLGIDPVTTIKEYFKNFSVQLSYKVGGFTDQSMITVSAEQTTPGSTNASVIIPNANYQVHLNKSNPVGTAVYSAVIVERTTTGYAVSGYSPTNPFFSIIPSVANNNVHPIIVNGTSVNIYQDSTKTVQAVAYGTEFATIQQVVDFLISYERFLILQGFSFKHFSQDLNTEQNWTLSVQELVYWSQQGWSAGNIIVLNPSATQLNLNTIGTIVDKITNISAGTSLLNQNFQPIKSNSYNILQQENAASGNTFTLTTLDGSTICYARLNLIQYEHVLVFDNVDDFGDIIYIPSQGTRQYRLGISGHKTGAWTGALSAPGYVYNSPVIQPWATGVDYRFGDIVSYNNFYYTATRDIPAATTFNSILWTRIQTDNVKTGLLQNFGHNAGQFNNIYDIDNPPTDSMLQEYSAGLIGFRQRQYLTDLGVSLPTQTKFYQGFIKEKGSMNAIAALTKSNFNNVQGNINVYEEWAFQSATYGGINTNNFREFVLDQSVFNTNPVAFTIADHYSTENIIANLTLANVYNASNTTSTVTSVYTNRIDSTYMADLPGVGYANLNDIDHTIFDIANYSGRLNVIDGDKVWVAKDSAGTWNIYRASDTQIEAIALDYALDSYGLLTFNEAHSFAVGDIFELRYFNDVFNGVYSVIEVPTPTKILIQVSDTPGEKVNGLTPISPLQTLIRALTITGIGVVYKFVPAVVDTVTDLINMDPPTAGWINNDHVWVNNATARYGWGVYTFNSPWASNTATRIAHTSTSNAGFGSVVKISDDEKYIFVGSPGSQQVYANAVGTSGSTVVTNSDVGFGSAIDTQGNLLVVASLSNVHVYRQAGNVITAIQTIANADVASVALSPDGTWLYIGGNNTVQAYTTSSRANVNYSLAASVTGTGMFGAKIKTNRDGSVLFVGAPTSTTEYSNNGNVYVYTQSANTLVQSQTLTSQHQNSNALFGSSIALDSTSNNLYIGAPGSTVGGFPNGVVEHYQLLANTYVINQTIQHPNNTVGQFGSSLGVSADGQVLTVGSAGSSTQEHTVFDAGLLLIDDGSTRFIDHIFNSGAVYIFEPIVDQRSTNHSRQYLYIQELEAQVSPGDRFGADVAVTRKLIAVGTPGAAAAGTAYTFSNPIGLAAWVQTRHQQPTVDIDSISRTFIYNKTNNNILAALDFIDPAKGKILNIAAQDIDYKLVNDPALYNAGTGPIAEDLHWAAPQVGTIWWNLDTVRYINYEQDALMYRMIKWGQRFPGSTIDIYQWVESSVLPSQYAGLGIPMHTDDSAYSTGGYVDPASGVVVVKYYFWVKDVATVAPNKRNSLISLTSIVENPTRQGVPVATILRDDSVAFYNVNNLLVGQNSVVQLGSQAINQNLDANVIHSEYTLVEENNPNSHLPDNILNKLIDSLAGVDRVGNPVPDPNLPPSQAYGISIRPRQSMIMNQSLALKNYVSIVNALLQAYPIVENKALTVLHSNETAPNPDSGVYSQTVNTYDELTYINTAALPVGYSVLVNEDATNNGKWAIYTFTGTKFVLASRVGAPYVQSYLTPLYWSYTDWYASNYNPTTTTNITVADKLEFGKLTLTPNTYIKINNNGSGNFVVYYIDSNLKQNLVGIQRGTIQINTGTIPPLELRQILIALQTQIFIDDLAKEYNNIFFSMIKYILTEQKNLDWVFKTSFISAAQAIRALEQFPSYIPDNQNFYLSYIEEVKPYRTQVREFVVDYIGNDTYASDITDFDLVPRWDANLSVYRSPNGSQSYDSAIQSTGINSQWYNNYTYRVTSIVVDAPGHGYLLPPAIIITGGGATVQATAYSTLNSTGGVESITVVTAGSHYTSTPTITINGTGTGATAHAILHNVYTGNQVGHNTTRSIATTIKFDRITYTNSNTFVFWNTITSANIGQTIANNTVIVLNESLYRLSNSYTITGNAITNTVVFPSLDTVTQIASSDFDTANDRIIAFNGNIDLSRVNGGLVFPGITVDGNTFVGNTFDNSIQSFYGNVFGTDPGDITVDGGAYVDAYHSHAPEELVPGRMYDNLNFKVIDTNHIAFRIVSDMNQEQSYYRVAASNSTKLTANLSLTDKFVYVENAAALAPPTMGYTATLSKTVLAPGSVFVNGEQINYNRNFAYETPTVWQPNTTIATSTLISYNSNLYLTTGNVFAATFTAILGNVLVTTANALGQIYRGVNGTGTPAIQPQGSAVQDVGLGQQIPNTKFGNVTTVGDTAYRVAEYPVYGLKLTSPFSGNVGDIITQNQTYSNVRILSMKLMETVTNATTIPVLIYSGLSYIGQQNNFYDGVYGFDSGGNDENDVIASPTAPTRRVGDYLATWTANTAFGNVLSGVTALEFNGNVYKIHGNVYGPTFSSVSANLEYSPSLTLDFNGTPTQANLSLQIGDQWANTISGDINTWTGSAWAPFTRTGYGFDSNLSGLYINGNLVPACYTVSAHILGKVNATGQITVPANTTLSTSNVWYNRGITTPSDGQGLTNSHTIQATFLQRNLG
jgi:hypothetical protein